MITFKDMHLSVFKLKNSAYPEGEGMVAWHARGPLVGDLDTKKFESETGIQNVSFYFTLTEWRGIMDGRISGCNDIGHNLRATGDIFTFFDMSYPTEPRGVMQVPYVQIHCPHHVRRILRRAVEIALRTCEPDGDRKTVEIPLSLRQRWDRHYGQGKGQIVFSTDEPTIAYVGECMGDPTFERSIVSVLRIAANRTSRWTEKAQLSIQKYHRGGEFSWCVYTPSGKFVMNGGIIDHGRDGKHDWSVHT